MAREKQTQPQQPQPQPQTDAEAAANPSDPTTTPSSHSVELEARPLAIEGNFATMLDWLGDLAGKRVLDVCCGTGTTSLLLAEAGAQEVVGCDVSESSLEVARRRAAAADARRRPNFVQHDLEAPRPEWEGRFDVLFGSYALHHLDLDRCLPLLAGFLKPGGRSIFLETSARNPVLRWSRRWLSGHDGVARDSAGGAGGPGGADGAETAGGARGARPLTRDDLQAISCHLGGCRLLQGEYTFLRIFDRQLLRHRWPVLSRACTSADRLVSSVYPSGSYDVIVACGPVGPGATLESAWSNRR